MKTTGFPGPYYGRFGGRGRDTPRGDLEHRLVVLAACVLAFVGPRCTGTARQSG
jgi:hypothetical protein